MSDEKKFDINDLDLSGLGTTIPAEDEDVLLENDEEDSSSEELQTEGYWLNHKPISQVTSEEVINWIAEKLPATDPENFNKSVFNTPSKREAAVDKAIAIYLSVGLLFPVKERPKEFLN